MKGDPLIRTNWRLLAPIALFAALPSFAQTPMTISTSSGIPESYERILLPVFTPPVHGAFGSEFRTDLRIMHSFGEPEVTLYGVSPICITCLPPPENAPLVLQPREEIGPEGIVYNGSPGRFLYASPGEAPLLAMNLRVYDVTRDAMNFGTEIPVVRQSDFVMKNHLTLLGVPTDPRFRNTLRIYADRRLPFLVTVGDREPVSIRLESGRDVFDPAYAVFDDFPIGSQPVRVTIKVDSPLAVVMPFWAFITVTNNETQMITTITPQP